MAILGIDPGKTGGMCLLNSNGKTIEHMFAFKDREYSEIAAGVASMVRHANVIIVENVSASPQQGVVSAFSFGRNFGTILGAIGATGWQPTLVRPSEWQGALGCLSRGNKKSLLEFTKKLFPEDYENKSYDRHTCDAVLLARYGWRRFYN